MSSRSRAPGSLQRFKEAKKLMRKVMPISRRVLGESHRLTLKSRKMYGEALYENPGATLDDLREAVTTLEDLERTARRVLGAAHPLTLRTESCLRSARRRELRLRDAASGQGVVNSILNSRGRKRT